MVLVYIGLGSNMGDPLENVKRAIQLLKDNTCLRNVRSSSFYKTSPVGIKSKKWFINAVAECQTNLDTFELLELCQDIEHQLGRVRTIKWGPRIIDVDILFYGGKIIKNEKLEIPHPQLHLRKFVLIPLGELNENLFHPIFKKTVNQLFKELHTNDIVIPLL